jgi:Protein of unknown function (DUF1769)/Protein of unknown function, DUF547
MSFDRDFASSTMATTTRATILTIPTSNPTLDANYVRETWLMNTTYLSTLSTVESLALITETTDTQQNNKNDVTSMVDETNVNDSGDDRNAAAALSTSLYISLLNTILVFYRPDITARTQTSEFVSKSSSTKVIPAITSNPPRGATTVVWVVPEALYQDLQSVQQQSRNNIDPDNECSVIVQLPSTGWNSRIVILSDNVDLQTVNDRRDRIQQIHQAIRYRQVPGHNVIGEENNPWMDVPLTTTATASTEVKSTPRGDSLDESVSAPPESLLPRFPSLDAKILSMAATNDLPSQSGLSSYQPLVLNSRTPIPFETELFRGTLLVILRPPNSNTLATEDPFWYEKIFQSKKRRCFINVQGQFKTVPKGVVYAGAEISQPMKLGLITKGVCSILLKLVERFNTNIHSSFGTTDPNSDSLEAAHIVAPAYSFFERLVITKPNEPPPSILNEIDESTESVQRRKSSTSQSTQPTLWNTNDTYTFSFYSMYIDLPTWQLVGLPASGDIGLQTFWGSSLLRICMYDKTDGMAQKQHVLTKNQYAFSVQLEFLGRKGENRKESSIVPMENQSISRQTSEDGAIDDYSGHDKKSKKSNIFDTDRRLRHNLLLQQQSIQGKNCSESQLFFHESSSCDSSIDEHDDDDDLPFFDAKESHSVINDDYTDIPVSQTPPIQQASTIPIDDKLMQQLSVLDQYCPYWVELCVPSRNTSSVQYVTAFACCVKADSTSLTATFRLESDCANVLDGYVDNSTSTTVAKSMESTMDRFSSRISSLEKLRRCMGLVLSDEYGSTVSHLRTMSFFREECGKANSYDADFLSETKSKPVIPNNVGLACFVARAYSDRHWVEEWACLYERHITFRHLEKRKSSEFVVILSNVIRVKKLPLDACPCDSQYPMLAVSTLASTVYIMFASDTVMEKWRQMIDPSQKQKEGTSRIIESLGAAADDFLHKSSIWNCKNRRILNCGSYYFRVDTEAIDALNPLLVAENALRQGTELSTNGIENCTENQLRDFITSAAKLKHAFVSGLDEVSRLAFYLNVYHTMISHAYLVLGPPDSSLKWINYFNNIAYQVGDDIFSLSELEHSIIRANMSYPTQFLSRFVIPKSAYPLLALSISDCRINFALNCGSYSNPSTIMLYQPQHLNQQLDDASRLYLLNSVTYRRTGSGDLELKLPRICQWFSDDFGSARADMLSVLESYLPLDVQRQLDGCRLTQSNRDEAQRRFDMSSIIVRYHSYNFECRPLSIS